MSINTQIRDWIEETPFVDTHEHLIEESLRLSATPDDRLFPCDDWAFMFLHYLSDDLASAGMPPEDLLRFRSPDVCVEEKYQLVAPWWERTRHTGYARAVRLTLQGLYGEDDLTAESAPRIAEKYRALVQPGFYRHIIRERSNIEHCQVNSLQRIFMETEQPNLLRQDLSIVALSTGLNPAEVERHTGKTADTLEGWLEVIDWYFATYGPRAVAVKNQSAYSRRLNYAAVPKEQAAALFPRFSRGEVLTADENKALQDYLFRYCVGKATEIGLPVKLHTGYYAGRNTMPLERLRRNAGDLCPLLQDFPDTRFVLMHIGYPYQDEFIALAKHYRNVYIDLCWAWIINPEAGVRFVREYLVAAPANKLFTFGGDYIPVEPIYGHSRIARHGVGLALSGLVADGWLRLEETRALVERLMRGNALETFPAPLV
jgi:predicted TIM-barrel fold metal-dependent hydrolase